MLKCISVQAGTIFNDRERLLLARYGLTATFRRNKGCWG